ncbi:MULTISPECIES: lysophospholipid acyltransferase family protein [unclassified Kitasatospora]
MSAAAENAPGEARVIPIESAPSWTSPEGPKPADRLAEAVGGALSGPLGQAATRLFGKGWEGRAAEGLAFLRRRVTGDYEVDEFGFDRELTEEVLLSLLRPLAEKYFRIDVQGVENIPAEGGALVVANHSGTIPLDALMTQVVIHDHHPARRHLRMLAADLVFVLPGINELARKAGHTLACNEDAQALLERGEVVGVWPEGFKGIGKPFSERYKLQRFGRGGFVASALRARVPIVPCSIVGAEETYPMIGNVKTLARLLGLPYVPITPTFPWLGPLGMLPLPTKWTIRFGEPIATDAYPAEAADDPMLVFDLADEVRETIQHSLYQLLVQRRSVFF